MVADNSVSEVTKPNWAHDMAKFVRAEYKKVTKELPPVAEKVARHVDFEGLNNLNFTQA